MYPSQRWWLSFPFLFALAVLVFLVWSVILALAYPYDGIVQIDPIGLVKEIDAGGPTSNVLGNGDRVLSIDGVPVTEAFPFYVHKHAGQRVLLVVQRNGITSQATITLLTPPFSESFNRLAPLFLALIFWGIGLGIQAFKPIDEAGSIYFLFFATSAAFLIAGATSYLGPPWTSALYNFLLWLLGPVAVHFHFYFPQKA